MGDVVDLDRYRNREFCDGCGWQKPRDWLCRYVANDTFKIDESVLRVGGVDLAMPTEPTLSVRVEFACPVCDAAYTVTWGDGSDFDDQDGALLVDRDDP